MAEKLNTNIENSQELSPDEQQESATEKIENLQERIEQVDHDHSLEKIQASIHQEAKSSDEISLTEQNPTQNSSHIYGMQRELKAEAYNQSMRKIRSRLNPVERSFSKVVHNKYMEPVNEISSKTIARPSAVLGGGIAALFGGGVVMYMAKLYGFEYNYTIFLILIGGGYIAGLLTELITSKLRKR